MVSLNSTKASDSAGACRIMIIDSFTHSRLDIGRISDNLDGDVESALLSWVVDPKSGYWYLDNMSMRNLAHWSTTGTCLKLRNRSAGSKYS